MTLRKLIACLHDIVTPLHPSLEWSLWARLAVLLCKKAGFGNAESTRKWGCLRLLGGKDYLLAGGASASSAQEGVQRAIAKVGCSARHANTLNNSPFDSCLFTINHQCLRVRMSCWGPVTSDASLARLGSLFFQSQTEYCWSNHVGTTLVPAVAGFQAMPVFSALKNCPLCLVEQSSFGFWIGTGREWETKQKPSSKLLKWIVHIALAKVVKQCHMSGNVQHLHSSCHYRPGFNAHLWSISLYNLISSGWEQGARFDMLDRSAFDDLQANQELYIYLLSFLAYAWGWQCWNAERREDQLPAICLPLQGIGIWFCPGSQSTLLQCPSGMVQAPVQLTWIIDLDHPLISFDHVHCQESILRVVQTLARRLHRTRASAVGT